MCDKNNILYDLIKIKKLKFKDNIFIFYRFFDYNIKVISCIFLILFS